MNLIDVIRRQFVRIVMVVCIVLASYFLLVAGSSSALAAEAGKIDGECGGKTEIKCEDGSFCDFSGFTCGKDFAVGTCKKVPELCAEFYSPVCGCDGKTYSNACKARSASQSLVSEGECKQDDKKFR